jgi:hypothetical protein
LSNIAKRTEAYNVAKTFLNNVGTAITPGSDNYLAAEALLKDVIADCEVDAFALQFIEHMDMFSKNSSGGFVVPMERSYNEAKKLYPKLPAVSVYASTDSNTAEYSLALSTYATANSVLIETSRTSNTERFINIVDILTSASDLSSDEKYRRIWKVAYDIIYTEAYDSTMSGFSAALTGFNNGPHAYFWQILQSEHLEVLEECASIIESDNAEYIEKAWASTFVIRYFEEQLPYIDSSNSRAFAIKTIAEECYAGLDQLKEEHDLLLETNYDLFKTAVEEMMVAEGYTQIKEKYLVAREYYYTMMIPDGAALEYVEFYESTEDWLNVVEADCTIFVEVASVIGGIDDRELLYRELVRGYACLGSLDNGFEGVEEATATFYSVYNAYESESESINAAVSVAQGVVCSVRANSPIASILEFLRSLFD